MNKISITLLTMLLATGVALAQDKTTDKSKTGGTTGTTTTTKAGADTKTGGTTTGTKAGADTKTGVKVDPKLGGDAKGGAKTGTTTTGEAAAGGMPEKPTIPAQVTDLAKTIKGNWRCTGDMMGPDGNPAYKMKATVKNTVDTNLGKLWIKTDFKETKQKTVKYPFQFTAYTTFNPSDNKWHRVMVDNWGGMAHGSSTGPDANGKVSWELEMSGPMGTSKFRDYEEPATVGKKKGVHMWGEMTMDGKTWMKVYDQTCTR